MPRTPGRPPSPTIHGSRTKPEAEQNAIKNRRINDWFRHDGRNIEVAPTPPQKLVGVVAEETAVKNKGEATKWYRHDLSHDYKNAPPANRCSTAEALKCSHKIYGSGYVDWYKHDDNHNWYPPKPAPRLTATGADEYAHKIKGDRVDWYNHTENVKRGDFTPSRPKSRTVTNQAADIAQQNGHHNANIWFGHRSKYDSGVGDMQPTCSRLTIAAAEDYKQQMKDGCASDWYGHDPTVSTEPDCAPRVSGYQAAENVEKNRGTGKSWFDHDANKNYHDSQPEPRCPTGAAKDMLRKSHGCMETFMKTENNRGYDSPRPEARVKPEAQEIARKSVQGMMDKFLNQDNNKNYQSPRPEPRAVRPEAQATFEKNKGCMGEFMEGYPAMAPKRPANRVKSEGAEFANRNKGSVNKLFTDYGKMPVSDRQNTRVKPEAEMFAERNKGTMQHLMNDYKKLELSGRPVPRLKTEVAEATALKYRGTIGHVLHQQATPKSGTVY